MALFLQDLEGGGAERSIISLAKGLAERGHRVDLLVTSGKGSYAENVPKTVRLVDFNVNQPLASVGPLCRYLRDEKPDALLSALNQPNVAALIAKRITKTPAKLIISIRNTLSEEAKNATSWRVKMMPGIVKLVARYADAVVAVSRGAADDFINLTGMASAKVRVIYNPVVDDELLRLAKIRPDHPFFAPGEPPVVLAAGRLVKQKDYPTLLRAFAAVKKNVDARLIILGVGPDKDELIALISELQLDDYVSLPGFVNPPYGYMGACRVYAMSSRFEGLPGALIQAMAAGASIVSTDCPSGPGEILENGRYGLLSPVGDVDAFAANLRTSLENPRPAPPESWDRFRFETAVAEYERLLIS